MPNKKPKDNKDKTPKKPSQVLRGFGEKITGKEVKKFQELFPDKPAKAVIKYDKKSKDVKLGPNAKKVLKKKKGGADGGAGDAGGAGGGAGNPNEGGGIFEPISAHERDIANIYADADKYVADAYSGAQIRGAELGLEGTKYSADKESEWRQAVAGIEVKGRLDLQPIINAGLEKVANIEAQANRDVADITGKYNVEGIKTRGEFDEKIGRINLAGSMYGLINSAFG
jgi:hypothetical protein